ncbi:RDD family protein [Naumannella huperziae]
MSDIPVGRPPAPPGRHAAPAGWYPDPVDPRRARYWDGWQWSRDTREQEPGSAAPGTQQPGLQQAGLQQAGGHHVGGQPGASSFGTPGRGGKAVATADGVPLAAWGARLGAWLLDLVIIGVVWVLITLPIWQRLFARVGAYYNEALAAEQAGLPIPPQPDPETLLSPDDQLWLSGALLLAAIVIHVGFLAWRSATPGQLLVGIRAVPVDRGREPGRLGAGAVAARTVARGLLPQIWLLWPLVIIDGVVAATDPKRQSVHDKISRTQVVRTR